MASSKEEIFQAFKPFVEKGMVRIVADLKENKKCKVIYNKIATLDKVLTSEELLRLQPSQKEIEAMNNGCKTDEEVIEYCNENIKVKKEEAIRTGNFVVCNTIGMFSCMDSSVDCGWDMVYEVVNPNGDIMYIREHCY